MSRSNLHHIESEERDNFTAEETDPHLDDPHLDDPHMDDPYREEAVPYDEDQPYLDDEERDHFSEGEDGEYRYDESEREDGARDSEGAPPYSDKDAYTEGEESQYSDRDRYTEDDEYDDRGDRYPEEGEDYAPDVVYPPRDHDAPSYIRAQARWLQAYHRVRQQIEEVRL